MKNSISSFLIVCFLSLIMVACSDNVEPNFSFSPDMPKRGQKVTFANLTTGEEDWEAESWTWTFGDGGKSLSKNPVYTYKEAGKYKVTLMVDSSKHKTKTLDITVYDTIPTIYTGIDSVKYYENVTFSALAYNPYANDVTYEWTFSENAVSDQLTDGKSKDEEVTLYFNKKKVMEYVSLHITIVNEIDTVIVDSFYVHDVKAKSLLMAQKGNLILRQRIFGNMTEPSENTEFFAGHNPFKLIANQDVLYVFDAGSDISEKANWSTDTSGDGSIRSIQLTDKTVTEIVHNRSMSAANGFYQGFVDKNYIYWTDRSEFVYRSELNKTLGAFTWNGNEEAQTSVPYYLLKTDRLGYFGKGLSSGQFNGGLYFYDQVYFWAKGGTGRGIYRFLATDILTAAATATTPVPTAGVILNDYAVRAFTIDELNRKIYFSVTAPADKIGFWVANIDGRNAKRIDDAPMDSELLYITGIMVDNESNRVYWAYRSPETLNMPSPSDSWADWYEKHPTHRTGVKMATLANEFKSTGPIQYFAPEVAAYGIALDHGKKF
ncbi:MAG: PKD domain-containing protein [Paludibacter sp.]|nr:PKD domain-containing protein [Paludibacter sp.]